MSTDMPKIYDPKTTEQHLYEWWKSNGWFKPEIHPDAEPFVISIPPPNITGELHVGHAMFVTLEDLMIRYYRMRGRAALWVPGSDHAGIATQLQVEKMLREEGTSREDIGREEFLKRTWEWKEKFGGIITRQLRRLGASCDWDRERFTLDDGLSRAVREAFVQLYEKGLIYRGEYLVNWSPQLKTAVSDLEVEYFEEDATLYYFKYPVAGADLSDGPGKGYIPVATARPETILGDTAVAIHPDDERYRHLIGKTCLVPMLNRTIPIIHDTYVDLEFGTGALKITPGHDPADYEIGQRHGLPIVNVLNPDATMNEHAGPYEGLDRFKCRERLWADMEAAGMTIKTEPYRTQVPRSQRGGELIEPMVSTQWFVKMQSLAKAGLEAVRDGRITIVPERFTKVYYNWLENIRDWCISRQLWWGHRIPVWYCDDCGAEFAARQDPSRCRECGSSRIRQDPDLLDTWFSSGLWPFSTLGWPDDTPDMRRYYPTDVMETAYDILFFWVARMIMMGLEFTNDIPFHTIYLHGLVRDAQGRKMSKTLDNVVDPLEVMDEYGTDALRFTLLTGSTPGNDMNLSLQRVEANRNFCNKIWNAARFVVGNVSASNESMSQPIDLSTHQLVDLPLADRWILSRLNRFIDQATNLFERYQYGEAGRQIYEFFWSEYCDWYLELSKIALYGDDEAAKDRTRAVLLHVFDQALRLLHPFIPFVTEEVWQALKRARPDVGEPWPEALMIASWPEPGPVDEQAERDFGLIMDLIHAIRNARAEHEVEPGRRIAAIISADGKGPLLRAQAPIICHLARVDPDQLRIEEHLAEQPTQALTLVVGGLQAFLPLAGMVDLTREWERLTKELEDLLDETDRTEDLLANEAFLSKAPAHIVERERAKLAAQHEQLEKLHARLDILETLP